jgi:hypothetical protein
MKLTATQLRKIIKEEVTRMLREEEAPPISKADAKNAIEDTIEQSPELADFLKNLDPKEMAALKKLASGTEKVELSEAIGDNKDFSAEAAGLSLFGMPGVAVSLTHMSPHLTELSDFLNQVIQKGNIVPTDSNVQMLAASLLAIAASAASIAYRRRTP